MGKGPQGADKGGGGRGGRGRGVIDKLDKMPQEEVRTYSRHSP